MLFGLFLLAMKTGFVDDIIIPSVAGAIVFALILNSLLNHWGYKLW